MNLVNFELYKSILPQFMIKSDFSEHVVNHLDSLSAPSIVPDMTLTIRFIYPLTMTEFVQFPETIVAGLAKFGGILAALRGLMIVMYWINKRQFERKVSEFLHK